MNNLEQLKNELLSQKSAIEAKGGNVQVANTNPSPAEITTGIATIPETDFSVVTASANDVSSGKIFYNSNGELASGTSTAMTSEVFNKVVMYPKTTDGTTTYYTLPSNTTYVRPYMFYNYPNSLYLTLNPEVTELGTGLLDEAVDAHITNFNEMENLTTIGDSALRGCKGIDLWNLPNSLQTIGSKAFQNTMSDGVKIGFGENIRSLGTYCFSSTEKVNIEYMVIATAVNLTSIPGYAFQNLLVSGDFEPPLATTNLAASCAYGSNFHNIKIYSNVTNIGSNAFNCAAADANNLHFCFSVQFYGNTPPTIGLNIITSKMLRSGFHIYVPDDAFDNYYTVSNLSNYRSYITRMSEMS